LGGHPEWDYRNIGLAYHPERDLNPARVAVLQAAAQRFSLVLQTP